MRMTENLALTGVAGVTALLAGTALTPVRNDAAAELATVVADISQLVHDFQAANDEHFARIDKQGTDFVSSDKVEKINAAITVANDNLREMQEQIVALETLAARPSAGGGENAEREERKFAASFYSQVRSVYQNPLQADLDMDGYRNYRDAFPAFLRANGHINNVPLDIRDALSVGSDPGGGYLVPPEVSMQIATRLFDTSEMRPLATTIQIGTDAWEQPKDVNDATSGGWVGEQQARATTATPEVGTQRIPAHEQFAFPEITQKMVDDAMIDIEAWLQNKTVDKMSRTENTAFVSGNGIAKPTGFLHYSAAATTADDDARDWGILQQVVSGAAGAFPKISGSLSDDAGALIDLVTKVKQVYRNGSNWVMNRNTEATVRKLRDADGRYLVGFGQLGEGVTGFSLHGYPIVNFEDMADIAADSYSIAYGNFRTGYLIVDRMGFRVLRDPFTNKPMVGLYITKRVGGDVVNFDAIKLMKFAA